MNTSTRVVLVTGGAYGIGRAICRYFAARRTAVVIADVDSTRGLELEEELRSSGADAVFLNTDVGNENMVCKLMESISERWGHLDVVCNNAGVERYRVAGDYTEADWQFVVGTNLHGTFLCSKYAIPLLCGVRGSIVNIASIQAIACEREISIYAASKAGILGLTRGLAVDYASHGIRVNAICPGAIRTGMFETALRSTTEPETLVNQLNTSIPLGRVGEPEDVAPLAYFLASSEASYITGAMFVVDGGVTAKLSI